MTVMCFLQIFKTKAKEYADKLLPAFNTNTGIPMGIVSFRTYVRILLVSDTSLVSDGLIHLVLQTSVKVVFGCSEHDAVL